jgi:phage terminase large subunit GpA-like protein
VSTVDAWRLIDRLFAEHLALPTLLKVDEWADQHRILPRETSAEPGPWRTERTPYMRQILRDLSDSSAAAEVVLMFGTQLSKSESGNNWLGYIIDHVPGPMMLIQPTVDLAKRYSKQRIAPMIRACPVLAGKVRESRSRDSGNTTLLKEFPGGLVVITGANSAAGLASMPCRYIHADEVDDYPLDVDGQGEPLQIATARQDTFSRRRLLVTSSPKRPKGLSLIEARYDAGTRFRYQVACPHCGHYQRLVWAGEEEQPGLRFWDDDPATAAYVCAGCGVRIDEHHKTAMLAGGVWVAEAPDAPVRSYHLSSLYSPLGWFSWRKLAAEYLVAKEAAARGDPQPRKTWINTRLAETYREEGARLDEDWLRKRAGARPLRTVPASCLVLTAGVDTQDNRLEVLVWAWGPGDECAIVDVGQIWGDPSQTERLAGGQPTVWERLDAFLEQRYRHESGNTLGVEAVAVDTGGHCTHAVYAYCRVRHATRVRAGGAEWVRRTYAIKGMDRPGMPVKGKASPVDVNWRGGVVKQGVKLWLAGVTAAKDWWHAHLRVKDVGPGFVHLASDLPDEFYQQMTSEQRVLARTARGQRYVWVKDSGKRNEAWDCSVYALFAAHALDLHRFTDAMWQRLRERVAPTQGDLLSPPVEMVSREAMPVAKPTENAPVPRVGAAPVQTPAPTPAPAPAPAPTAAAPRRWRVLSKGTS